MTEYVEIKFPRELATELYMKGTIAKIMELEEQVGKLKKDVELTRADLELVKSTLRELLKNRGGLEDGEKVS